MNTILKRRSKKKIYRCFNDQSLIIVTLKKKIFTLANIEGIIDPSGEIPLGLIKTLYLEGTKNFQSFYKFTKIFRDFQLYIDTKAYGVQEIRKPANNLSKNQNCFVPNFIS